MSTRTYTRRPRTATICESCNGQRATETVVVDGVPFAVCGMCSDRADPVFMEHATDRMGRPLLWSGAVREYPTGLADLARILAPFLLVAVSTAGPAVLALLAVGPPAAVVTGLAALAVAWQIGRVRQSRRDARVEQVYQDGLRAARTSSQSGRLVQGEIVEDNRG